MAVSLITYGELYEGAYCARDQRLALGALAVFLVEFDILPLTVPIMERFAILRGSLSKNLRQQIGDMDLLIGATALHHGLILVTHNQKDFQHLPGIDLYDPLSSSP